MLEDDGAHGIVGGKYGGKIGGTVQRVKAQGRCEAETSSRP